MAAGPPGLEFESHRSAPAHSIPARCQPGLAGHSTVSTPWSQRHHSRLPRCIAEFFVHPSCVYFFVFQCVAARVSPGDQHRAEGHSSGPRRVPRSRPAGPTCALSPAASCNPCPWGGAPPLCRWRALRPANVFFLFVLRPCSSPCLTSPLSGLPHVPQFGAAFSSWEEISNGIFRENCQNRPREIHNCQNGPSGQPKFQRGPFWHLHNIPCSQIRSGLGECPK